MKELDNLEEKLIILKAERDVLRRNYATTKNNLKIESKKYEDATKARLLLQQIAERTQSNLEFHISNIVSTALQSVFSEPYDFIARFTKRRNQTECDLLFTKDGEEFSPLDDSGGGPVDVASLALRIAMWSLNKKGSTFILDEPLKWLSADLHSKGSKMFNVLSRKLGIQFIIVSHLPDFIESADKVFTIKKGKIIDEQ